MMLPSFQIIYKKRREAWAPPTAEALNGDLSEAQGLHAGIGCQPPGSKFWRNHRGEGRRAAEKKGSRRKGMPVPPQTRTSEYRTPSPAVPPSMGHETSVSSQPLCCQLRSWAQSREDIPSHTTSKHQTGGWKLGPNPTAFPPPALSAIPNPCSPEGS